MYTDGSNIEGKVGEAVTVWEGGREVGKTKISLASYCSVYQAELYSILEALRLAAGRVRWHKASIVSEVTLGRR